MEFNFLDEFSNYPTLDLLKIVKQPTHYQPPAVEAAHIILSGRQISQEEIEEADRRIYTDKGGNKRVIPDVFRLIFVPSDDLRTSRWLKFLWLVLAAQYFRSLYQWLPWLFSFFRCEDCGLNIVWLTSLVNTIYIPVIFYLLLKKSRWGWIILFGEIVFSGVLLQIPFLRSVFELAQSIYRLDFMRVDRFNLLWSIIIETLFFVLLLRKEVTEHYGIDDRVKTTTIIVGVVVALLFMVSVRYLY